MDIQKEYAYLIILYYKTVDTLRGKQLEINEKWLFDAETLSVKLFNHLASLLHLSFGTPLPQFENCSRSFYDHSSVNVLARVAFETYLTFFYIYCDNSHDIEMRKFRHLIWKLSAPLDRKDYAFASETALKKLEEDKQVMMKLMAEVESNQVFLSLEGRLRKKALKGEWKLGRSWPDIAEEAGFDKQAFRNVYRYLCSYAHSGGLSGLQVGQATNPEDQKQLSNISLHFGLLLMSHFLFSFTSLFPETRHCFVGDDYGYALADKWHITWKEEEFKSNSEL